MKWTLDEMDWDECKRTGAGRWSARVKWGFCGWAKRRAFAVCIRKGVSVCKVVSICAVHVSKVR